MSVAFRRESDEDHKEPRFEIPLPPGPNLVTARGLRQMREKAAQLESTLAIEADETRLEAARRDLRYWNTRLVTAQVPPPPSTESVAFGSRVTFIQNGRRRTIEIVGSDEADPAQGRVPFTAPLAAALIGAAVGDYVEFGTPSVELEIVATEPIEPA